MMFKLLMHMPSPLALILVAAVIWWGVTFNVRLEERYHCTACTFWGIAGGFVGMLCWMIAWDEPLTLKSAIVWMIAVVITLALFLSNRAKSGSTTRGILMTVWQLFAGLAVIALISALDTRKKKKK